MYTPNQNSFQQQSTQMKANYANYNTRGNLGNPKNGATGFMPTEIAYNQPNYMTHNLPMHMSDEHIFNENVKTLTKKINRKKKLWISDKNAESDSQGLPENFSVFVQNKFRDIRSIKITQVVVDYTAADATEILSAGVYFRNFPQAEENTNGQRYHCMFPVTQGTDGTSVKFTYGYNDTYISDFKQFYELSGSLPVEVFYEDTSGNFVPFTSLNRISIELEITTLEFSEKDNSPSIS